MAFFSRRKTPPQSHSQIPSKSSSHSAIRNVPDPMSKTDGCVWSAGTVDTALEESILEFGGSLLDHARQKKAGVLSAQFWSDKLMDWAMKDEAFKIQFFRFVDTYPSLKTPEQIHDHLVDYLTQPGVTTPPGMDMMTKAGGMAKGIFTSRMTKQITGMAQKYIAGENAAASAPVLSKLWKQGMCFTVDLLGEACTSARVADYYQRQYLDLVENLPSLVSDFKPNDLLDTDYLGKIPRVNVSIKVTSLYWGVDPVDTKGSINALIERLAPILEAAGRNNVFINFDVEQDAFKDLNLELFETCCAKFDFQAGLAMQAYLRSGMADAKRVVTWAKKANKQITVRLVKGAYWDYETINAEANGWPVPVWSRKPDSDASFERMATYFIENMPRTPDEPGVKLALGSHNARSISHSVAMARKCGLPDSAIEYQMLHGMGAELKKATLQMGLRVREYLPVGEMLAGMAYFVRRLLENTSNESWLRAGFSDNAPVAELLQNPVTIAPPEDDPHQGRDPGVDLIATAPERHQLSPAYSGVGDGRPFFNEPHRNFAYKSVRDAFASAINSSTLPSKLATLSNAEEAIGTAYSTLDEWHGNTAEERAIVLCDAAKIIRARRDEIAGMVIRSTGQCWHDADAEVCAAIDYCEYYARLSVDASKPIRIGRFIGESSETIHEPLGLVLAYIPDITPFSRFAGLVSAAVGVGNTMTAVVNNNVAPLLSEFHNILLMAGAPGGLVTMVPQSVVSDTIQYDSRIACISYIGETEKGLSIVQSAGTTSDDQPHIKHCIAEFEGPNVVIVDTSADLGEAITLIAESAFGNAGHNLDSCSVVIIVDSAYDDCIARLTEVAGSMRIGNTLDPANTIGHVMSLDHSRVITNRIQQLQSRGKTALACSLPPSSQLASGKAYLGPHIIIDIPLDSSLLETDVTGPVLAICKASSFEEAVSAVESMNHRRSTTVYSRKPANITFARNTLMTGRLHINGSSTSSRVGRHPVKPFGRSGTGAGLGSADYLYEFTQKRCIVENMMRRGFAPDI